MPWNIQRDAAFYEKEILKYATGTEARKNVVIDATTVSANGDGRYIVEAGTVLVVAGSKVGPAASSGVSAANVVGILTHTVELFGNANAKYDEPAAAFFHECIFDASKLTNYSGNAANVKTALPTCLFQ